MPSPGCHGQQQGLYIRPTHLSQAGDEPLKEDDAGHPTWHYVGKAVCTRTITNTIISMSDFPHSRLFLDLCRFDQAKTPPGVFEARSGLHLDSFIWQLHVLCNLVHIHRADIAAQTRLFSSLDA
jgi:hypothetical protein